MIYEPSKGISIFLAAQRAVARARAVNSEVSFLFNEIELHVSPTSNSDDIAIIYGLKCDLRRARAEA